MAGPRGGMSLSLDLLRFLWLGKLHYPSEPQSAEACWLEYLFEIPGDVPEPGFAQVSLAPEASLPFSA